MCIWRVMSFDGSFALGRMVLACGTVPSRLFHSWTVFRADFSPFSPKCNINSRKPVIDDWSYFLTFLLFISHCLLGYLLQIIWPLPGAVSYVAVQMNCFSLQYRFSTGSWSKDSSLRGGFLEFTIDHGFRFTLTILNHHSFVSSSINFLPFFRNVLHTQLRYLHSLWVIWHLSFRHLSFQRVQESSLNTELYPKSRVFSSTNFDEFVLRKVSPLLSRKLEQDHTISGYCTRISSTTHEAH